MRKLHTVFYLILFAVFISGCRTGKTANIFGNMTYMVGDESFGPQVWAEARNIPGGDNQDSSKCNIADLYASGMVDEVKRNLRCFSVAPESCPECANSIRAILNCQDILEHRSLMIAQFPESEGGENVYIAIDTKPMRYFKLWMHPTGKGTYQMRLLKEVNIMAEEEFFAHLETDLSELWQGF